jgi:hypothetical protein
MAITPSAGNRRTWTFSTWVKRSSLTGNQDLITSGTAEAVVSYIYFTSANGIFGFEEYSGGYQIHMKSNAYLRDISAWYNLIVAVDTTQGTDSNRIKMYINGTQTSFSTSTYPSENFECNINSNTLHNIGCEQNGTNCIDGYLAETVFIDGLQLGADSFGEFDSDSPTIWKPIDVSGLTFGTNGFYLSYSDSADLGADSSGNSNDFTATNLAATDQATDTPTNNFATLNILDGTQGNSTFSEGNCKIAFSSGDYMWARSTTGMSSGKWYAEFKNVTSQEHSYVAICVDGADDTSTYIGGGGGAAAGVNDEFEWGYKTSSGGVWNNASEASYGDTYTDGDIISVALDLDNNKLYFAKNGTWQDSGDPTSGATGTGAVSITAPASTSTGFYFFAVVDGTSASAGGFEANFGGCPAFTVSSGNADADGYGNFEYAVPSGYYALCTKNLGAYGG